MPFRGGSAASGGAVPQSIGDYTRSVLRSLVEQGVDLALASGRHFEDVRAISKLFGNDVCTISSNGAAVYDGNGDVMTTFSLPSTLEVMVAGVSKGAALERVCARRRFDLSEVIAFGDGLNDLEMLRAAGEGVLMANADARLKRELSDCRVIDSNSNEAVARHLEEIFGGQ